MKRLIMTAAVLFVATAASAAITEPVKLDSGMVSGAPGNDAAVRVFKGIPFAAPPVGPLRWKAPQPPAKWDGVKTAVASGRRCVKGGGGGRAGAPPPSRTTEDCLYTTVWPSAASPSGKRPSMLWSYAGAFPGGAAPVPGMT